ncbi:DNA-binding transcriptional LysR family regulator [Azospirillum lipoferum]|uniref:LysR family transcriptional regulator n=1 Tax=Azospirillum lipoferum TaxID=193 RepID=A0A5A9GGG9_AZOLI|nr:MULTISPECIES: LysR family transcriptional regulator [Azospirillum]KAA0592792.1 LysR family transcriptional regulator [Azospirillum lipoferum]MCP1614251.1 DNA-binding transcriptional LysR family regulator [Azospirillum lipoferum]MDW5531965.1 LysR family transcriptional regulator [Azospirillum sp. NL1]
MSGINLKLLQTFLLAAESGSFRKAAEESNRSPSAVSMQIKDLEEQIGISLFVRTPQRVSLTSEGQILFEEIGRAMGDVQASLDRLTELAARRKGKIQIACAPTLAASRLGDILSTFKLRYPRSVVEVQETPPQAALALLQNQEVEFYIGPEVPNLNEFQFESIIDDPLVSCIPDEFYNGEKKIGLEALAQFPLIMLNRKTAVRGLVDRLTRKEGIELKVQYEVESAQTALALASSGLGVSIVPSIALGPKVDHHFHVVPLDNPNSRRAVGIITARGYVQHRYAEQLIILIRTKLREG